MSVAGAQPVVLVHGFLATRTLMWPMQRRLERRGHAVFTVPLSPLVVQDVRVLAAQLDQGIERLRSKLGVDRVDVVGVSQGGVLALWWAHHLGGFARTRSLVLVGAPVRGTWAAAAGLPFAGAWSAGIWQLLPGSTLQSELVRPLPTGSRVRTLALRGDLVSPPERCRLPDAPHETVQSGLAGWGYGPLTHQALVLSRSVTERVRYALTDTP